MMSQLQYQEFLFAMVTLTEIIAIFLSVSLSLASSHEAGMCAS